MRGRKNPPLEIVPVPEGAPLVFDTMAQAYLEDYLLQRYRTLTTARARVEHLREFFGGWGVEAITPGRRPAGSCPHYGVIVSSLAPLAEVPLGLVTTTSHCRFFFGPPDRISTVAVS